MAQSGAEKYSGRSSEGRKWRRKTRTPEEEIRLRPASKARVRSVNGQGRSLESKGGLGSSASELTL
jgi:hypothetical protein